MHSATVKRALVWVCFGLVWGALASEAPETFAQRAQRKYTEARAALALDPENADRLRELAHWTYEWANVCTDKDECVRVAEEGMAAARKIIAGDAKSGIGHYYLALNTGQVAKVKRLSALGLVNQVEAELLKAIELDPTFHYAGPHRLLGRLYRDAPGWPVSVGNKKKAREYLENAVKLSPEYPENRMLLLEALLEWGEKDAAREQYLKLDETLRKARKDFQGPDFEDNWLRWDRRWRIIRGQLGLGVAD